MSASSATRAAHVPTLAKAPLPLEQLSQLQRRMAHMLTSLGELQDHVGNAASLEEWPLLLGRHLTLVSQSQSLAQFLSLANPNALNPQLARLDEALIEDAQQNNKFSGANGGDESAAMSNALGDASDARANDALFGGKASTQADMPNETKGLHDDDEDGAADVQSFLKLPKVQYSSEEENPLTRIAPHPFYPLDAEKSQTVIPSLLLPRGIDATVYEEAQARWIGWLKEHADGVQEESDISSVDVEMKRQWIKTLRHQMYVHDAFAQQALRSWFHAREATDDLGQRYDWRMRLAPDEESDEEMDEEANEEQDVQEAKKRKREDENATDAAEEADLSIEQVRRLLRTGQT